MQEYIRNLEVAIDEEVKRLNDPEVFSETYMDADKDTFHIHFKYGKYAVRRSFRLDNIANLKMGVVEFAEYIVDSAMDKFKEIRK